MTTVVKVGQWVRRHKDGAKWHRVESVIAGEPVTRCGRRLDVLDAQGRSFDVSETEVLTRVIGQPQNCKRC